MIRVALALALATALVAAQPQPAGGTGGTGTAAGGGGAGGAGGGEQARGKAAVSGGEGGRAGGRLFTPLWDVPSDQLRFRERPDIRGSVATATNLLMKSGLGHEPMSASVFFTPDTVITYKNGLPNSGVYRGYSGLFDFGARSKLTFHATAFNYSIPFVDEARGTSIVKLQYAGRFLRSGKTLESTATCYIKWRLGKIRSILLVDDEPLAVWHAFASPAELVVGKFYEQLFSCGECASELLANDIKVTARMHPKALADKLSYQGIEEFKKRANSEDFQNALKSVRDIHILYGDENTVVVMYKFGAGSIAENVALSGIKADPQFLPGGHGTSIGALSDMRGVAIIRVKDGKIASCIGQLSQPLMPWQVAHVVAGMPENKGKPFIGGGRSGAAGAVGQSQAKGTGETRGTGAGSGEKKAVEQKAGEQKPEQQQKGTGAGGGGGEQQQQQQQQKPSGGDAQRKPLRSDEFF